MVSIVAFQAVDLGSIPGQRKFFFPSTLISPLLFSLLFAIYIYFDLFLFSSSFFNQQVINERKNIQTIKIKEQACHFQIPTRTK